MPSLFLFNLTLCLIPFPPSSSEIAKTDYATNFAAFLNAAPASTP